MTTIPTTPINGDFSLSDYLTKEDISIITKLGTTMVTTRIINGAVLGDHYIIGDNQAKLFKRSYIKQRVKEYKPTFDISLIDTYTPEVEQVTTKEQPTATTDNTELIQSLRDHNQSLKDQVANLQTDNALKQETLNKVLEINKNYQAQVQTLITKDNLTIETPKSDVLNQNEVSKQPDKKKGWFGLW